MARADQHDGAGNHEEESPRHAPKDRQQLAKSAQSDARSNAGSDAKLIQVSGSGLSGPFIRRPVMTVLLTLSVIVAGIATYNKLAVNDLPAVDYPVIQVTCAYPGANPTTMANNIATPLEKQFLQIPGLDIITSASTQGNTSFTLQFVLSKSIVDAATDVQERSSNREIAGRLPSPPTFKNKSERPGGFICSICSPTHLLTESLK
jgi:multidrug efflux pump subunit AcrB